VRGTKITYQQKQAKKNEQKYISTKTSKEKSTKIHINKKQAKIKELK
jgi:hypothetical protein